MAGRVRPPDEIARLQATGRAMRRGGATQVEIARALNVPGSTIARWAGKAAGGNPGQRKLDPSFRWEPPVLAKRVRAGLARIPDRCARMMAIQGGIS